jgi:hypothetical protein
MSGKQYFEDSEETGFDDLVNIDVELISTSSYNEDLLSKKIEESGLKKELFACALQLAIVGWGRGNYGNVTIGGEKRDLTDIFDESGVYYNNEAGAQLDPEDLTPKRLVRLFRFQIQKWIKRRAGQSFLVRKYGVGLGSAYNEYIFPGAEHLILEKRHANALIACYSVIDNNQHSHFVDRIKNVFRTRNVDFDN